MLTRTLLAASLFFLTPKAHAFPQAIGYGYTSCLNCHYNPLGNGPLTDYGRALGATVFSARPFFLPSTVTDDKLAEYSGFLGRVDRMPNWLRAQAGFREMLLTSGLESQPKSVWILMQADFNLILKFMRDHLYFVGNIGYVPVPRNASPQTKNTISTVISREHYGAYRFSNAFGLYAGFMDIAFGLRVPEHTAYIRTKALLDKNDQTHGILGHFSGRSYDAAFHLIAGNLFQDSTTAQRGISAIGERDVAQNTRLGASVLMTKSSLRGRTMGAIHTRWGIQEGHAVLAELGLAKDSPTGRDSQTNALGFFQTQSRVTRGLNFLTTWEYYTDQFEGSLPQFFRFGPTLQYLPFQRLELRFDFYSTRQWGGTSVNPDTLMLLSQVHLWL